MNIGEKRRDPGLARVAEFLADLSDTGCTAAQAHDVLRVFQQASWLTLDGALDLLDAVAGAAAEATIPATITQEPAHA